MRKVIYGSNTMEITDASLSVEEIKQTLVQVFPELSNSTYEVNGNEITFKAAAGTKGADVIYTAEDGSQIMVRKPFIKKTYRFLSVSSPSLFELRDSRLSLADAIQLFHMQNDAYEKDKYSVTEENNVVKVHLVKKKCPTCHRHF